MPQALPNHKLLVVTHSDRPVDAQQCHLNFLQQRYERPDRLPPAGRFIDLPPLSRDWHGAFTIWDISNDLTPTLLAAYRCDDFRPQHAIWYRNRLWVLGTSQDLLQVVTPDLKRVETTITDPWMSGTHTLAVNQQGDLIVSCSGSDSILIVDETRRSVTAAHRLPEQIYGRNYDLKRTDSVHDHYIHNDVQLTHINCASPWKDGIVVSTLIQGALGWFDGSYNYRELTRGFVGCHGVRQNSEGQLYFSDSCLGTLCFLDDKFRIQRRYNANSIWLHDSLQITDTVYALAVADRNTIEFVDIRQWKTVSTISGEKFGKSVQFLYYGN